MWNLDLELKKHVSAFRKMALGTWRTGHDPSIHGSILVKMDAALEYIEAFRRAKGKRVTVTHLVAKAVAMALRGLPDANAVVRFNRIYLRKDVSVFMQVALTDEGEGKIDLSGVTIAKADEKTLEEIADETAARVETVRKRKDARLEKARGAFHYIPYPLLSGVTDFLAFLNFELNLDLSALGIPKDAFGSILVTNVGSLGLEEGYPPLVPMSYCPIVLAVGEVREAAVSENGQVVSRKVMKLCATMDHRIVDGVHTAAMSRTLRDWLENPFERFDPVERG